MGETTCPRCGAGTAAEPGFSTWCHACDWNADPQARPAPDAGTRQGRRTLERRRRDLDRAVALAEAVRRDPAAGRADRVRAVLASAPVNLVTLALVAVVVVALLTHDSWLETVLFCGVAGTLLWVVRPRLGHVPDGPTVLGRDDAPALHDLVDQVCEATGARRPDLVEVDAGLGTDCVVVGLRRVRVLQLGLPTWALASPQARVASIARAVGRDAVADVERSLPVSAALSALRGWTEALDPGEPEPWDQVHLFTTPGTAPAWVEHLSWRNALWGRIEFYTGDSLKEATEKTLLKPFHRLAVAAGGLVERAVLRAAHTTAYRTDLLAARVAGTDAVVEDLDLTLASERSMRALHRCLVQGRTDDFWLAYAAGLDTPASEVERARRADRQRPVAANGWFPPTWLRLDVVTAAPVEPAVTLTWAQADLADREVMAVAAAVTEQLDAEALASA